MPKQLAFTRFLNHHFAAQVNGFLGGLHIHPAYPSAPITNAFAMELLIFAGLLIYFILIRVSLSVEKPATVQHFAEMTHEFVGSQSESIIGHGYERFTTYLTALLLFILAGNLMGLVPGLASPTASPVVPLGFALVTFAYYHYHGIRANGFSYVKQFLGPVWWLYPLMLADRDHLALRAYPLAHGPSLRQHVRRRSGHARVLLADPNRHSADLS